MLYSETLKRLNLYCPVAGLSQGVLVNKAVNEFLDAKERDPKIKARMDRAAALKAELAALATEK